MTWHVVVETRAGDASVPAVPPADQLLRVPIGIAGDPQGVSLSLADRFAERALVPQAAALEFLCATVGAYTADVRVPRKSAFDGWTRDMVLYLPVRDTGAWEAAAAPFQRALRFLTGDHWRIVIRPSDRGLSLAPTRPPRHVSPLDADTACLFSGGLDSYVGAIDRLAEGRQTVLVGHHSLGGGPTSSSQRRALEALRTRYAAEQAPFLKLWVSPPKGQGRVSEITTRGRSALFLGLGVAVASGLPGGRLVVPENGLISLNVPLTASRLGSLSTRTTHPHLISLFRETLAALGVGVEIELPYRFATKGELLRHCRDQAALREGLPATMSCARPGAGRFEPGGSPNRHCGYCFPCLIRQSAIRAAFGSDPTTYRKNVQLDELSLGQRSDVRAVRMALHRYALRPPRIADVLVPGPLPASGPDLAEYFAVFRRGIDELRRFLA